MCVVGKVTAPKGLLLASGRKDDDSDEGSHVDGESDSDERIDADADGHVCCVLWLSPCGRESGEARQC